MKTVKEIARKYTVHTEEHGDVIPVSKLEELFETFQARPMEEKLSELDSAMQELSKMFNDLGSKLND